MMLDNDENMEDFSNFSDYLSPPQFKETSRTGFHIGLCIVTSGKSGFEKVRVQLGQGRPFVAKAGRLRKFTALDNLR